MFPFGWFLLALSVLVVVTLLFLVGWLVFRN
jgi:hypothetical protein